MRLPVVVGGNRRLELISPTAHHGNDSHLSRILSGLDHFDLTGRINEKDPIRDGHGGYSDVFAGCIPSGYLYDRRTFLTKDGNVKVAIKTLRVRLNRDMQLAKSLAKEMAIWSKLDHPNILPFLGYMFEKDYPSLISEWMELGTVRQFLRERPEFDIKTLALGVAEGLQYIHARGIVHSDIKTDNILIDPSGSPLICDFGISRMLDASESRFVSTTHDGNAKGSARWMAVELHLPVEDEDPKHTKETDVWAYGMTLYELVTKELPYNHIRQDMHVMLAVCRGELPRFPDSDDSDDIRLREICSLCWAKSARERPTMSQIIQTLLSYSGETTADCIKVLRYSDERVEMFPLQARGSHLLRYELPMSMDGEGAYMEVDDANLNDREQSLFQRGIGNAVQSGQAQEQQTATPRSGAMSHQQSQRHDVKYWPRVTFPTMSRERFMFMLLSGWERSGIIFDQRMITVGDRMIDLYQLHMEVLQLGGAVNVKRHDLWGVIAAKMGWNLAAISEAGRTQDRIADKFKVVYEKLLETFQQTYMAAAMKQSLTTPPQPPSEHHGTSNQPTTALNQPRSQQSINPQEALHMIKLAGTSAEQMRAQGYPENLIQKIDVHQERMLPRPTPLLIRQGPFSVNLAPPPASVSPRPQPPHSPQQNLRPSPARIPPIPPVCPPIVTRGKTTLLARLLFSGPSESLQISKTEKTRARAKTRPNARRSSKVVQPNMNAVLSGPTTSSAATNTTGPNASMPAAEPAPSPAQVSSSLAETSLKRSRDELVGQGGSAGTEGMTYEGTPSKRIRTNWESTPDAELPKHQIEAEGIKSTEDAAKFYSDMTQVLELSNDVTLSPEVCEALAQPVKTVRHGIEIPDTPGSSSLSGLPNDGTCLHKEADSNDFLQPFDFTAFQQAYEKADTPELVLTSSTNPSSESGAETDHPGCPGPSGSINDRIKIADAADSKPKGDFFDTGSDTATRYLG